MSGNGASTPSGEKTGCFGLTSLQILRILGGLCGIVIIALGIVTMVDAGGSVKAWVNGFYQICFGILIVAAELRISYVLQWFTFLTVFLGFGAFYIFVGGLALGSEWYEYVLGAIFIFVGIVYCGLACCCKRMEGEAKLKGKNSEGYQAGTASTPAEPASAV